MKLKHTLLEVDILSETELQRGRSPIQGGPTGCGLTYVDIKLKVPPPEDKLLIMKRNFKFEVNTG